MKPRCPRFEGIVTFQNFDLDHVDARVLLSCNGVCVIELTDRIEFEFIREGREALEKSAQCEIKRFYRVHRERWRSGLLRLAFDVSEGLGISGASFDRDLKAS